jgi:invasion protein IalB
VRIIPKLSRLLALPCLGLALVVATSGLAAAQSSQQQPSQFGPRAGKTGQQPAQQGVQPPKVDIVAEHGDWKIQCESAPAAAEGQPPQRQCGMVQTAKNEKNPKATLTLVLVRTVAAEKVQINMRVIAPIGVFLPTGVALEIDGGAVGRVPFTRCMPQVCMAFAEASPETLVKMKKGKEANFIIYEAPGIGLPMKLSLSGFSAGLADLEKN